MLIEPVTAIYLIVSLLDRRLLLGFCYFNAQSFILSAIWDRSSLLQEGKHETSSCTTVLVMVFREMLYASEQYQHSCFRVQNWSICFYSSSVYSTTAPKVQLLTTAFELFYFVHTGNQKVCHYVRTSSLLIPQMFALQEQKK